MAGICPSRFRGCLRKSVPDVHPLRRRGTNVVAARRYVTSLRTTDSVLATDRPPPTEIPESATARYATPAIARSVREPCAFHPEFQVLPCPSPVLLAPGPGARQTLPATGSRSHASLPKGHVLTDSWIARAWSEILRIHRNSVFSHGSSRCRATLASQYHTLLVNRRRKLPGPLSHPMPIPSPSVLGQPLDRRRLHGFCCPIAMICRLTMVRGDHIAPQNHSMLRLHRIYRRTLPDKPCPA